MKTETNDYGSYKSITNEYFSIASARNYNICIIDKKFLLVGIDTIMSLVQMRQLLVHRNQDEI